MCMCECDGVRVHVCECVHVESSDRMTSSLIQASCEWFWTQRNVPRIRKGLPAAALFYFFLFWQLDKCLVTTGPQQHRLGPGGLQPTAATATC